MNARMNVAARRSVTPLSEPVDMQERGLDTLQAGQMRVEVPGACVSRTGLSTGGPILA
jgi:hypothetical protein